VTPHQKKILFRRASSVVTPGSGADFATLDEIEEKGLKEAAISARKQVTVCVDICTKAYEPLEFEPLYNSRNLHFEV
jgi:hypothetical protein